MKKKQDTSLNDSKDDLKFEIIIEDLLIYDIMSRKKPI